MTCAVNACYQLCDDFEELLQLAARALIEYEGLRYRCAAHACVKQ
jgi:hypothetical protein